MDAAYRSLTAGLRLPRPAPSVASATTRAPAPAPLLDYFGGAPKRARPSDVPRAPHPPSSARVTSQRDAPASETSDDDNDDDDDDDGDDDNDGDEDDPSASPALFAGGGARTYAPVLRPEAAADAARARAAAAARAGVRALRKSVGLSVRGADSPDSIGSFSGMCDVLSATVVARVASARGVDAASVGRDYSVARSVILGRAEASAYTEPTAIQMQSLPTILAGRDLLAAAPTGSGKTASFLLPLLTLLARPCARAAGVGGPRALVLVPTHELATQIAREADRLGGAALGVKTVVLSQEAASGTIGVRVDFDGSGGGSGSRGKKRRRRDARGDDTTGGDHGRVAPTTSSGDGDNAMLPRVVLPALPKCDVLVTTPGLITSLLRHAAGGAGGGDDAASAATTAPVLASVRHVILDEVDTLLDLGVIELIDEILCALPTPESLRALAATLPGGPSREGVAAAASACVVQRIMLSATLPPGIEELALTVLRDPVRVAVGVRDTTAAAVEQSLIFVGKERGKTLALRQMLSSGITPPVLLFAQSAARVDQVARFLALEGAPRVGVIHEGLTIAQREAAVTSFRRGDTIFLVASDVVGRGIDFRGVSVVVNFDFPQSAISYVHRVGRTGRAGKSGRAVTLYTEDDIPMLRSIANVMKLSGCAVPAWQLALKKLDRSKAKRVKSKAPKRKGVGA